MMVGVEYINKICIFITKYPNIKLTFLTYCSFLTFLVKTRWPRQGGLFPVAVRPIDHSDGKSV